MASCDAREIGLAPRASAAEKSSVGWQGFETMTEYRVVDLGTSVIDPEDRIITGVTTAEAAAEAALGLKLVRSGRKADLRARVYFQMPGGPLNMVRLYTPPVYL